LIIDLPRSRRCRRAGEESGARLDIARDAALDGAILDINLDGKLSFPIGAMLSERGIPYFL
jgi:hypothetical protein